MSNAASPPPRRPTLPGSLLAPARIIPQGRFELRHELGAGATGTVWQAWDRHRGAEVALKVLHRVDAEVLRRFKQEFRTLADLRHPNIVRFHELFEDDERLFFSMELVDGVDVLSWIWGYTDRRDAGPCSDFGDEVTQPSALHVTGPKVDYARLRDVFAQLVDGLERLHAAGYLHRDLKPSNVLVRHNGRAVILDFGLAASLRAPTRADLESAVGTVTYMAPEIAQQRGAEPSADHYSLGVLLFEALTGRVPFSGSHVSEILAAKHTREAPSPRAFAPEVPPDLDELCAALLQRDPRRRAGHAELVAVFGEPAAPRPRSSAGAAPSRDAAVPLAEFPALACGSGVFARPPVLGRERELEILLGDLRNVARHGMQCRLVTGASGIGKSSLIEAFVLRLRERRPEATVLLGRCHDREAIPYRAVDGLVDALAHHLGGLTAATRAALRPARAALLMDTFPVLRGLWVATREGRGVAASSPHEAFEALRSLFAAVARLGPLALVIDDLHLTDPGSLELIDRVFRGDDAPPLLLIGLGRPGVMMDLICRREEAGGSCLHRLDLGPLGEEEAERVASAQAVYLGVPAIDARSVAIDTRGHPGFICEVLRAHRASLRRELLAGRPRPRPRGASLSPAPEEPRDAPTLESVLAKRVLALRGAQRRILGLLAVAGGLCSVALATRALGLSTGEVADAVDDLVDADLIVATGRGVDDAIELYHERIREVVDATLGESEAEALARALTEWPDRGRERAAEPALLAPPADHAPEPPGADDARGGEE